MRIDINFRSVKNLSDLSYGEKLLEILNKYGLIIEKTNEYEPINKPFCISDFPKIWKSNGDSCDFMFKGSKEISFFGEASWLLNAHPDYKGHCGISMWLNIKKNYDISKLLKLGDELFIWCDAFRGEITERAKDPVNSYVEYVNSGEMLYHLFWANYFGKPYLDEPDFNIPIDHVKVGNGIRFMMAERPDDEKLSDNNYIKMRKNEIGDEWFWKKEIYEAEKAETYKNGFPKAGTIELVPLDKCEPSIQNKAPFFDRSEITRQGD